MRIQIVSRLSGYDGDVRLRLGILSQREWRM